MSALQAEPIRTYRFRQPDVDSALAAHYALARAEQALPDLIMNVSWCEQRYFTFAEFFYAFEVA